MSENSENENNGQRHPGELSQHMMHEIEKQHIHGRESGREDMMTSPQAAADFLRRFFIVTGLLVPLFLFSNIGVTYLGVPDFPYRKFAEFGIATTIFYFGLVFFKHARHEMVTRRYGMMTLVSLGVGAGYFFSTLSTFLPSLQGEFYLEISTLIWVLLIGHYLEAKSSTAAGDALQEVAKLLPKEAHLVVGKETREVDISRLGKGDIVLVKPGEKVPADGIIVEGGGNFDESHISGESKPVQKKGGSKVIAGSISLDGAVEVKLDKVGAESTIGQIQELVAKAEKTKPSAQRLADRAARLLTFAAIGVSIVSFLVWTLIVGETLVFASTLAITVLVIACPHALGLAIPTVSTITTRLAVKNGIFIKDMAKIEVVKDADYILFDKTGTLTKGEFGVSSVELLEGDEEEALSIVGSLEKKSSHVIGEAIASYAEEKAGAFMEVQELENLAGRGIKGEINGKTYFAGSDRLVKEKGLFTPEVQKVTERLAGEGKTTVYVLDRDRVMVVIGLSDQVKAESKEAVGKLHKLGFKVGMLTGDIEAAALPVAEKLGIDRVFAQILPEDKYKYVKELQGKGNVVVMTGDGVNDAPALTQADVGVAIGAGTDVAVESGDVVLTQSNPADLVKLVILSRKVYAKMLQNLWWALGYNIFAIPAAAGLFVPFGFRLSPAVGAALMSLSAVMVVINALSLKRLDL